MRRGKKQVKKIKTWLGRVVRDIQRKIENNREHKFYFQTILELAKRVLIQEKTSSNKIYSLHAPEVECIAKGKAGKKYEFGCKISLVVTYKEGLALNVEALHGNPFDGHTLEGTLEKAEELTGHKIERTFVDKGYRGHGVKDKEVIISGQKKGRTPWLKKMMKRRQAIEPHIGHMKSEGKLNRNYLKGKLGDQMNALLVGIGHNLRLILATLRRTKEEMFLLTG